MLSRLLLWPAFGLAILALGYWQTRNGSGWGPLMAAIAAGAFAEAARVEAATVAVDGEIWLFSRRNAIWAAVPFAMFGAWTAYLVALFVYATASFFYLQQLRRIASS
jgi:hypothetical protein